MIIVLRWVTIESNKVKRTLRSTLNKITKDCLLSLYNPGTLADIGGSIRSSGNKTCCREKCEQRNTMGDNAQSRTSETTQARALKYSESAHRGFRDGGIERGSRGPSWR